MACQGIIIDGALALSLNVKANGENTIGGDTNVINCPINGIGHCAVTCNKKNSCDKLIINGTHSGTLTYQITNESAIPSLSTIYCPNGNIAGPYNGLTPCIISSTGPSSNVWNDMIIYGVESFYDVSFICPNGCFNYSHRPNIACGIDYTINTCLLNVYQNKYVFQFICDFA